MLCLQVHGEAFTKELNNIYYLPKTKVLKSVKNHSNLLEHLLGLAIPYRPSNIYTLSMPATSAILFKKTHQIEPIHQALIRLTNYNRSSIEYLSSLNI